MKRALVLGASGQDGNFLSRLLKEKGYFVHGVSRGHGDGRCDRWTQLDVADAGGVMSLLDAAPYDEVYYLAAEQQSSQADDAGHPAGRLFDVNLNSYVALLEHATRSVTPPRIFYASSSLIFGDGEGHPATESTRPAPQCLYSISKLAGRLVSEHYRRAHGLHVSVGILFNHESPLRRPNFLSRRIVDGIHAIGCGTATELVVGDLYAGCDWGYAVDYVDAMWRMLQCDAGDTYVVATGQLHTVSDWVRTCCDLAELDTKQVVREDPSLLTRGRAAVAGDSTKLRTVTGWQPSMPFNGMVEHIYRSLSCV